MTDHMSWCERRHRPHESCAMAVHLTAPPGLLQYDPADVVGGVELTGRLRDHCRMAVELAFVVIDEGDFEVLVDEVWPQLLTLVAQQRGAFRDGLVEAGV